jgi:hypothetical protein
MKNVGRQRGVVLDQFGNFFDVNIRLAEQREQSRQNPRSGRELIDLLDPVV